MAHSHQFKSDFSIDYVLKGDSHISFQVFKNDIFNIGTIVVDKENLTISINKSKNVCPLSSIDLLEISLKYLIDFNLNNYTLITNDTILDFKLKYYFNNKIIDNIIFINNISLERKNLLNYKYDLVIWN